MPERVMMAPSILSADFTDLGAAVRLVQEAGADFIHVDVMDGHYVPNLTIGPPVVKALKRVATVPLDVHLMISNAEVSVDQYLEAGADWITVHVEACEHLHRIVSHIRASGAHPAVSLNPATPIEHIRDVIADVDMVLLMSVNPGFGGQSFIPRTTRRVRMLANMCAEEGVFPLIQVDGGIDLATAPLVVAEGARVLVSGSAVFCADDPARALREIRHAAESAIV
ncbi:MAG: ribulose-phosphate 3-epimerase [Clostridiales bacterium]|nr:ribulose-phosphate 3-epimerase [Clostridiales bacterium]